MLREVSRNILEGLIRSSRRSLLPDKEELDRVGIELVEAEKNVHQKKTHFRRLCEMHLEARQAYTDVLNEAIPIAIEETFNSSFRSLGKWISHEKLEIDHAENQLRQAENELRQKSACYEKLHKEYLDKMKDHADVFAASGMSLGEMAARLGDLVPNRDKSSFFAALALPSDAKQVRDI